MKIGVFQTSFTQAGGAEKVIVETARHLPHHQWVLHVLTYDPKIRSFFTTQPFEKIIPIEGGSLPSRPSRIFARPEFASLAEYRSFSRYLRTNGSAVAPFDVVVAHLPFSTVIALQEGTPSLWYVHCPTRYLYEQWIRDHNDRLVGTLPVLGAMVRSYLRIIEARCAKRFDKVLCNSHHMQGTVKRLFGREAEVIYPGVTIPPDEHRYEGATFIFPSRLVHYKRQDIAVKAMHYLRDCPGITLKIIGSGPDEARLRAMVADLQLSSVEFSGSVPELSAYYLNALGVIFLSRDEDFGMVPVEAMAHGCPVLAVKEGGTAETVVDGETGLFIEPEPQVVAKAMRALYCDRARARKLGDAGKKRAERFSWEAHARKFDAALHAVAERKRKG